MARAAALGFGVLEALRDTPIVVEGQPQRLIDQTDLVMGVSGGSLIAAHHTLKGPNGFADFELEFLNARLQSDLLWRLGSPRSLWRLGSSRFGRSDLASLPIARAVAASSAAPVVLSPVALWNYAPAGAWPNSTRCATPTRKDRSSPTSTWWTVACRTTCWRADRSISSTSSAA